MGKINYGRVILGGIAGGIVAGTLDWFFNGILLGQLWTDAVKTLNHPLAFTGPAFLPLGVYLPFIVGSILLIWVYAGIRPRFGAGVRTAFYAGLIAWAFADLLPNTSWYVTGIFDGRLMLYSTLFGMVEIVVGAIVGAALYKEAESAPADYPVAAEARQAMR
jgi:hypothetical protein